MNSKHHTIIVVPHAKARFHKWRVSNLQIAAGSIAAGLLTAVSLFTTWSFVTKGVEPGEVHQLRAENEQLRAVNQDFEEGIRTLQQRLVTFENRTRQLAIVAGVAAGDSGQDIGIGGTDEPTWPSDPIQSLGTLDNRSDNLSAHLQSIEDRFDERPRWISATPAIAPVKGFISSGYGYRRDPMTGKRAPHWAIDISTAPGNPVRATADAIVLKSGRIGNLGNAVYLSHGYGVTTRYGHLSRIAVEPGQKISRGEMIGTVGSTGRATGYHLHYEVRVDGKPKNPLSYILDSTSNSS
jgi:murein DD-endopeptidase MepM/ murein hydrolase activator NlpD